jgi:hypothetical protein
MTSIFASHSYFLSNFIFHLPLYIIHSQINGLDDQRRKEMSDKLVMHCRGPKEIVVKYNRYVINGKLFHTLALDV